MTNDKLCPCCKTRDEIIGKLIQVKTMNWISVKDRLPENTDDVLVIGDGWDGMNWWRIYFMEDNVWFTIDGDEVNKASQLKITHWMPLPEPPKK